MWVFRAQHMKKQNKPKTEKNSSGNPQQSGPEEPQDLNYNQQEDSYEMDVNDNDPDWEHPMDYDTLSKGAREDDSTYDEANPYVGEEYADQEELNEEQLDQQQMYIDRGRIVHLSTHDEKLSENAEDQRDDLDEEGYPVKDAKNKQED